MNKNFNDKQIEAYAAAFEVGDAIWCDGEWWEVKKSTERGLTCEAPNRFVIRHHYGYLAIEGFKEEDPYRVTTLADYELQGGEKLIWLGESDGGRTFGKAYRLDNYKFFTCDNGISNWPVFGGNGKWAVIPKYEQVTKDEEQPTPKLTNGQSSSDEVALDEVAIHSEIITRLVKQTIKGVKKYGDPVQHDNLSTVDWIDHAIDESVDQIVYLTALKHSLLSKGESE